MREATSGKTPPYLAGTPTCEATTLEAICRPSSTTAAAVSSQDVSIPNRRVSLGGGGGALTAGARPPDGARLGFFRSAGALAGCAFRWGTPAPPQGQDEIHRVGGQHLRPVGADPDRILDPDPKPALRIV